ncbi:MAG: signal peptidase II [Chloroflexi bacterium]|nr:signal peptidase II [Chloroflexota bacterium]
MKRVVNLGFLVLMACIVVGLDQWTKALVRANLALGQRWNPIQGLRPFINLTYWTNTGMAFGQFKGGGQALTIVAFVVTGIIIWYYWQLPSGQWLVRLALGMQLGGAIGNLIDRLRFGTVTDFIEVTHFPVFNLADASISVGVAVLALVLWLEGRAKHPAAAEREAASPPAPTPVRE